MLGEPNGAQPRPFSGRGWGAANEPRAEPIRTLGITHVGRTPRSRGLENGSLRSGGPAMAESFQPADPHLFSVLRYDRFLQPVRPFVE